LHARSCLDTGDDVRGAAAAATAGGGGCRVSNTHTHHQTQSNNKMAEQLLQKFRNLYGRASTILERWSAAHTAASGLFASATVRTAVQAEPSSCPTARKHAKVATLEPINWYKSKYPYRDLLVSCPAFALSHGNLCRPLRYERHRAPAFAVGRRAVRPAGSEVPGPAARRARRPGRGAGPRSHHARLGARAVSRARGMGLGMYSG
jgi:hypothetical protein